MTIFDINRPKMVLISNFGLVLIDIFVTSWFPFDWDLLKSPGRSNRWCLAITKWLLLEQEQGDFMPGLPSGNRLLYHWTTYFGVIISSIALMVGFVLKILVALIIWTVFQKNICTSEIQPFVCFIFRHILSKNMYKSWNF